MQAWWLDAVTMPDHKQWDVLLVHNDQGTITAALPFLTGKKFGLSYAVTPQLTQYTGVWLKPDIKANKEEQLSEEMQVQRQLVEKLKEKHFSFFETRCAPEYANWLPFYWDGYKQTTKYTYRIPDISDPQAVFDSFHYSKQKQIRKAISSNISVDFSMTPEELYDLQCLQLTANKKKNVLSRQLVTHLITASRQRGQSLIARAKDTDGNTHAAIFVVWDENSAYELISAIHPDYRASGASTLVVWEAMKKLSKTTKMWDFEGSMIEKVENSFRKFGAEQVQYFQLTKTNKLIELISLLCR